MANHMYFGETLTVSIQDDAATPNSYTVGVIQDVTITAAWDLKTLYGAGSIKRQGAARTNFKVDVEAKYGEFDGSLILAIMGEDGTPASSGNGITDSPYPEYFTIEGTVTATDGTNTYKVTVEDVVFHNLAWNFTPEEFIVEDIKGEGADVKVTQPSA
ncbi:hypothetical protein B6U67_00860 [Methanosarcinales archaeon ex4484_138]|nr:MAG: hypothetical protein B6U67_00860 [Methanosarcinales archaeon ex4484_138]